LILRKLTILSASPGALDAVPREKDPQAGAVAEVTALDQEVEAGTIIDEIHDEADLQ